MYGMLPLFRKRNRSVQDEALYVNGLLRAWHPQKVLESCTGVYAQLRKEVDFSPDQVGYYLEDIVKALVYYIHGLPANQFSHGSTTAGLLRVCLRTAFLAQRRAHGLVVAAHMRPDARSAAERGWRYAALIAGLIYPVGMLSQLSAYSQDRSLRWRPEQGALFDFLKANKLKTYVPVWSINERSGSSAASVRTWIAARIVQPGIAEFISQETDQYFDELLAVLGGRASRDDLLFSVVSRAYDDALRQELLTRGESLSGTPVEDVSVRVSHCLQLAIMDPATRSDLVRRDVEAVFVCWPEIADEIRATARRNDVIGVPDTNDAVLKSLGDSGVIVEMRPGVWVHEVMFPERTGGLVVPCLKLHDQECLGELPHIRAEAVEWVNENRKDSDKPVLTDISGAETGRLKETATEVSIAEDLDEAVERTEKTIESTASKQSAGAQPQDPNQRLAYWLKTVSAEDEHYGWWTDKGKACLWPDVAERVGVKPQDFLRVLRETGAACKSRGGALPLIHELAREGRPALAIIISRAYWDKYLSEAVR